MEGSSKVSGANITIDKSRRRRRQSSANGAGGVSAESKKRRARHEIWDLEDEIERQLALIAELETAQKSLRKKQEFMQQAVAVRERQLELFKYYSDSSNVALAAAAGRCSAASMPGEPTPHSSPSNVSCEGPMSSACSLVYNNQQFEPLSPGRLEACFDLSVESWSPQVQPASVGNNACLQAPTDYRTAKDQEVHRLLALGEKQLVQHYKQASEQLSNLLYQAEDPTSARAGFTSQQLAMRIEEMRASDAIVKVCNPAAVCTFSQPVSSGLGLADDDHWWHVASALLLTPQQVEDVKALNDMLMTWLSRLHKDHGVVNGMLHDVLSREAGLSNQWLVSCSANDVRKAELEAKAGRVVDANRWALLLVDALLIQNILTPLQVARLLVHSYPYVPDACAVVAAVAHKGQASTTSSSPAQSLATRCST